jgi:hypothetical protein
LEVTRHMPLEDRKLRENSECDGKSKLFCRSLLFRNILSNGRDATERVDTPCHQHSLCVPMRTQRPNSQKLELSNAQKTPPTLQEYYRLNDTNDSKFHLHKQIENKKKCESGGLGVRVVFQDQGKWFSASAEDVDIPRYSTRAIGDGVSGITTGTTSPSLLSFAG